MISCAILEFTHEPARISAWLTEKKRWHTVNPIAWESECLETYFLKATHPFQSSWLFWQYPLSSFEWPLSSGVRPGWPQPSRLSQCRVYTICYRCCPVRGVSLPVHMQQQNYKCSKQWITNSHRGAKIKQMPYLGHF